MTQPYQVTSTAAILRTIDGAMIPVDPSNADYRAYQMWLKDGNVPDPIPPSVALTAFLVQVQAVLDRSDVTMLRTQEAISLGLNSATNADVVSYMNYRRALRALLRSTSISALPTEPAHPVGS